MQRERESRDRPKRICITCTCIHIFSLVILPGRNSEERHQNQKKEIDINMKSNHYISIIICRHRVVVIIIINFLAPIDDIQCSLLIIDLILLLCIIFSVCRDH